MSRVMCMATVVWIAALTGAVAAQIPSSAPAPAAPQKVRVGVYDSRMVALAYYNGADHQKFMQELMAQLKAAKAANDATRITELEYQGPALQNLMHYQVFSNASIPNVMERLTADLPTITVPTLTIGGAHDTMDPAHMEWMARTVQKGRYLHCPNGSHLSQYDDQETYVNGVVGFIRDVDWGRF